MKTEHILDIKTYSQRSVVYKFLSYPIRYFLRKKCFEKIEEIKRDKEIIESCMIYLRGCGRTETAHNSVMYHIFKISKAKRFLIWWL